MMTLHTRLFDNNDNASLTLFSRLTVSGMMSLTLFLACFVTQDAMAQSALPGAQGSVTGLPLPRYASLKSDRVNLREGPSKDHRTLWVFQREGLPVEITAEFETWRRIRDSEGTEGWVLHSLLSGRRSSLVTPWIKLEKNELQPLFERADDQAKISAKLQSGVIVNVKNCNGSWCRITGKDFDGYIRQNRLWGVYPNERVE
jgi:SH3-like domain-containing protein